MLRRPAVGGQSPLSSCIRAPSVRSSSSIRASAKPVDWMRVAELSRAPPPSSTSASEAQNALEARSTPFRSDSALLLDSATTAAAAGKESGPAGAQQKDAPGAKPGFATADADEEALWSLAGFEAAGGGNGHGHGHGRDAGAGSGAFASSPGMSAEALSYRPPLPRSELPSLPTMRARTPRGVLGVSEDASYEETAAARDYLLALYGDHSPSREAIELAMDAVLSEAMKERHRWRFDPDPSRRAAAKARAARRGGSGAADLAEDVAGDAGEAAVREERERVLSRWERVVDRFEPHVPLSTVVNEGLTYGALAAWCWWQTASIRDPTLPLGVAAAYAIFHIHRKRLRKLPVGQTAGGGAFYAALISTVCRLAGAYAVASIMGAAVPALFERSEVKMAAVVFLLGTLHTIMK